MKIFLTGRPGVGKSTVFMKIVEMLKERNIKVGGFVTPEIRENGKRMGFLVKDLGSGEERIFVSTNFKQGKRFGRYLVDVQAFEEIAIKAMEFGMKECEIIAIDEIGKMEFLSKIFREKIYEILESEKTMVAVVHRNYAERFKKFGEVIIVTVQNRNELPKIIVNKILQILR